MLIKMLSEKEKRHFIDLADLLIITNQPLLWDGKISDEITSDTNLSALSFQESRKEVELIAELEEYSGNVRVRSGTVIGFSGFSQSSALAWKNSNTTDIAPEPRGSTLIVEHLLETLKDYPFMKMDNPETRIEASMSVLKNLLEDHIYEIPSTAKIVLFELLLVALRAGQISDMQLILIKEIQRHHNIDDFVFDDLLERAEVINIEFSKTISMILE